MAKKGILERLKDGVVLGDGGYLLDFNALITAQPAKAPAVGATVQIQCWFRDPLSTANQTTSLSDALEFSLCQ